MVKVANIAQQRRERGKTVVASCPSAMGRKGEASKEGEKAALGVFAILYSLRDWLGEDTLQGFCQDFFPLCLKRVILQYN